EFANQNSLSLPEESIELSFGKINRLVTFANRQIFKQEQEVMEKLRQLKTNTYAERLLAIPEFAEMETPEVEKLVTSWLFLEKETLKENPAKFSLLQEMLLALSQFQTNKNKKLILQSLFLKM